jgi:hypothetical protein
MDAERMNDCDHERLRGAHADSRSLFAAGPPVAKRVIILGRGGAGKSTLARALGEMSGLPVVELDKHFWKSGLQPTPLDEWIRLQEELAAHQHWIMDGDLGPYDALWVRLRRADTVIILDFPLPLCAWRAFRRGAENVDFWLWVLTWGWTWRPKLMREITAHARHARVHVLRTPAAVRRFLEEEAGRLMTPRLQKNDGCKEFPPA